MSGRWWLVGLVVAGLWLAACDGDDSDRDGTATPDPTQSATPTATATVSPTATPTSTPDGTATAEPQDPVHPPGSPTGIASVDAVVEAVLAFEGDYSALDELVAYTEIGCTLELGGGGPPKCSNVPGAEQVEGTLVEVFPFSVCELEWEPRSESLSRVLGMLFEPAPGAGGELFVAGVYAVAPVAEPSVWPAGDHAVVFGRLTTDEATGAVVRVAEAGIVSIELGCGPTPPSAFATGLVSGLLEPPLGGLSLAGDGVVAAVERLPASATEETDPRWLAVLDLRVTVNGYHSVLVDAETELVDPSGASVDIDDVAPGVAIAVEGVPWPWSFWRAERVVVGN